MSDAGDRQAPTATQPEEEDQERNHDRYWKILRYKRSEFLDHLWRNLDRITYCYFGYLYYLDCSFFRFFLRCAIQMNYLTPKPTGLPMVPQKRSDIIALFGSGGFCFLWHIIASAPSAGELTNGYLHGGLIIDFIGQEGPISKWRLVYMDFAILFLQLVMLTVIAVKNDHDIESVRIEEGRQPPQDLDSEERGETRRYSTSQESSNGRSAQAQGDEEAVLMNGDEPVAGSAETNMQKKTFEISSGEYLIAKIDIVEQVKKQWKEGVTVTTDAPAIPHLRPTT
ncbi:DUF1746-domain-containing protein [Choiromyces venosus 120613-1]|uniref:DUF1746-domain-containing protein n=1 Tax=Choiromyces venosus 120613-1 TaxID=1336337 RepID=A0A3N4JFU7_9PEZI|nr:DUF1746-domain-containing protein [Choiromyces venosus 120613-1]